MKYTITHTCGHTETIDIGGTTKDRERRIAWLESFACPECQEAKRKTAFEEAKSERHLISIPYGKWKNEWQTAMLYWDTMTDYNKETKCMDILLDDEGFDRYNFILMMADFFEARRQAEQKPKTMRLYIQGGYAFLDSFYNQYIPTEEEATVEERFKAFCEEHPKLVALEIPAPAPEEPKEEVVIAYRDYKTYPHNFKSINDSYDSRDKTIRVLMTATEQEAFETWKKEQEAKAAAEEANWQEVEMPYKEFKKSYSEYKHWNYNHRTSTIMVKIPSSMTYEPKDKHYAEKHEFHAGYTDNLEIVPEVINPDDITVVIPTDLLNEREL